MTPSVTPASGPVASIVISSYNRIELLRRTLWAVAERPPSARFEVVIVDDASTEPVLDEVRLYGARFEWSFVSVDTREFEKKTGVKKFFNNPALTNNIGVRRARGRWIFQQGNEVIPVGDCYDALLAEAWAATEWAGTDGRDTHMSPAELVLLSTTYNVPRHALIHADRCGTNLGPATAEACRPWVLGSEHYRSDVTNYLSLCRKSLFEAVGGYDERYLAGVGGEDSDFVRRCRAYGAVVNYSPAVSLHQDHGGRTRYGHQDQSVITDERWREGEKIKWGLYNAWDGSFANGQSWPWGQFGVAGVVKNW